VLPNEKTVLNLDHIARIDIEEISRWDWVYAQFFYLPI
jgi:hypothetical protein